jgi:hypothetical protein
MFRQLLCVGLLALTCSLAVPQSAEAFHGRRSCGYGYGRPERVSVGYRGGYYAPAYRSSFYGPRYGGFYGGRGFYGPGYGGYGFGPGMGVGWGSGFYGW